MSLSKSWTKEQDAFIYQHYRQDADRILALRLSRSLRSVQHRRAKLGLAKVALKRWSAHEDGIIRLAAREARKRDYMYQCLGILAQRLGRRLSEVSTRSRKLGINFRAIKRRNRNVRGYPVNGCKNGRWIFVHREVMEKHIGRYVLPSERIHHINLVKTENGIRNLLLCSSPSEHRRIHVQAELLLPELMRRGFVRFNRTKRIYSICATSR